MDCPHCGKAIHDSWSQANIVSVPINSEEPRPFVLWNVSNTVCPACKKVTIRLTETRHNTGAQGPDILTDFRAYPKNTFRKPTPNEVPTDIKQDYEEACAVLPTSEKGSAALARRCLQAILRGQGYVQRDLMQQIDALLNEKDAAKAIPTALRQTVDAIRNFGNFSAHPITDQTTLQVLEVEPEEAEWCLEILDEMFDHYYVKPAQAAARKAALDAKLIAARKPRSK
jgi:hypothetical protein